MHITLISGSHRPKGESGRVTRFLEKALKKIDGSVTTDIIDLAGNPLPLWDESFWEAGSALAKQWAPYAEKLRVSDGFVVVSPEWHGMVPSGLKNFFLFCTQREVGHKPAAIVAVSASRGGAYPVDELRHSSYKNSRILYIPEHLIVRNAAKIFMGDAAADKDDAYLRERADYVLKLLLGYAKALPPARALMDDKAYPSGM